MTSTINVPAGGEKISIQDGKLKVPEKAIIPFVEGDGTGPDIWRASKRVFDAAVAKAYQGKREIAWVEVYAGEKAFNKFGSWLPDETIETFREYLVGIKGPLTTPVGGGIRSLNVALRKALDAGFDRLELLKTDEDLNSLRKDPRFESLMAAAAQPTPATP